MKLHELESNVPLFLKNIKPSVTDYSLELYKRHLELFFRFVKDRKDEEISTAIVSEWIHSMAAANLSSRTIFAYYRTLDRYLYWCVDHNILTDNPVVRRQLPKLAVTPKNEKRVFEDEDYRRLLAICRQYDDMDWHDACVVGRNTALRLGDMANLKWDQLDWDDEFVSLVPAKTKRFGKRVRVPMSSELFTVLNDRKGRPDDRFPNLEEYVFPAFHLSYKYHHHSRLKDQFFYRCERAAVPKIGFHALRHTMISKLANGDVNYGIISSMTGQSIKQIQEYHHVSLDAQRRAIGKVI